VLTVKDDGVGIKPANNSHGNGMRNMRERAAKLGGTFDVRSKPGEGTTLRISFPV
jgi:signal transduction histidine kinase